MKRKFEHPAPSTRELNGPKYWRSLDELAQTPGFQEQLHREFPEGASTIDGVDRRHFMKIMAASFALGGVGLAGCRRPERNILPFGKSVEGIIPGLPQYYATAMPLRKDAIPLLAETHQGRPTKLEGNPTYTPYGGRAPITAQASVLDLYDPERARAHTKGGAVLTTAAVNALLADIGRGFTESQGAGLAFLAEESASPTRARLIRALKQKFPHAIWAEYEPAAEEPPLAAAQAAFGANVKPLYNFAKAKRIVSIDCDFLAAETGAVFYARSYANGRRLNSPKDEMNRLYVAESALTLTGSLADHRLRLASSHMMGFAAALALALGGKVSDTEALRPFAAGLDVNPEWIKACAEDLAANAGASIVVAGSHLPAAVHGVVYAINAALGNIGQTIDFVTVQPTEAASIQDLASALKASSIKTLVVLGGNPVYNAPADLGWDKLQSSVQQVIRYGYYGDETSALSAVHIAAAHYLESWGDARTADGTIVAVQPMIMPLFGGLTEIEVLARIAGEAKSDPYELVTATIAEIAGGSDTEKVMRRFLHDGLLQDSAYPAAQVSYNGRNAAALLRNAPKLVAVDDNNLEVRFVIDHKVDDGRFANNGWLQEVSHPITKISWDNAILMSPKLAKKLDIYPKGALLQVARIEEGEVDSLAREQAHVIEIEVNGRKIRGPVHIQPGLANYTLVVALGYGRTHSGTVGQNTGFNAYVARTSDTLHVATGATVHKTDERYALCNTQEHWSMEGRDLVREANYDEYRENPGFVREVGMESETPSTIGLVGEKMTPQQRATGIPRGNSLYSTPNDKHGGFDGIHQWGMAIDLNTCIGCNACVIACQAENNIPIVGKEQSLRGRQMHWIRIDRYYSDGDIDSAAFGGEGNKKLPEDPQISLQPVNCQQCELAPCEMVCPVNATVHDNEGLNVMAYNRCIGTRYCANNCPYKVRRFNYFDWNERRLDSLYLGPLGPHGMPELVKMVKNPEVTIRMRGVMEKCTYCVQRIENGKIRHKVKMAQDGNPADMGKVAVPDGTIVPACAQTCPVDAIVFGNILDQESAVSKMKARQQDYQLLGYLNTRPRTTYSARIRNPNPKMPDYRDQPLSRIEHAKKNEPNAGEESGKAESHSHDEKKAHGDHAVIGAIKRHGGLS